MAEPQSSGTAGPWSRSQCALDLVNFFVADVAGLGALTFIYCITPIAEGGRGMNRTTAGILMALLGLLGVVAAPLVGLLVDSVRHKRVFIGFGLCCTAGSYVLLIVGRSTIVVGAVLCLQGLVGAVYGPSLNALSLGIVGYERLPERKARNEVSTHLGTLVSAVLPIVLVTTEEGYWRFFAVTALLSTAGTAGLLLIRGTDYSHERARGMAPRAGAVPFAHGREEPPDTPGAPAAVLRRPGVAFFCAACATFHLSNAAMLPEVGAKLDYLYNHSAPGEAAELHLFSVTLPLDGKNGVSMSTFIAQFVMVPVALACGWLARQRWCGSKRALQLGFATLMVRGVGFAFCGRPWGLLALQMLDGVGAGSFGVLSVLIMSDLTEGTGRFNLMQGVLAASSGIGGAVSNALGGVLADTAGFETMFLTLAGIALLATLLLAAVRPPHQALQPLAHSDAARPAEPQCEQAL